MTHKVFTTEAMPSELRQPSFWQIGRGDRGYLLHSLPTFLLCYSLRTPLVTSLPFKVTFLCCFCNEDLRIIFKVFSRLRNVKNLPRYCVYWYTSWGQLLTLLCSSNTTSLLVFGTFVSLLLDSYHIELVILFCCQCC